MGDSDPFQRVSGTTGLTGAVDTMFVLEKAPDCTSGGGMWNTWS